MHLPLISRLLARFTRDQRSPSAPRIGGSGRTLAGIWVTPDTAIQVAAVWACLRYLSQTVAVLPWHVLAATPRGAEIQRNNPIDNLLSERPSLEWSSFQFRETLLHWALRWGNGYAEIERNRVGVPIALHPIHPDRVTPVRLPDGALGYEVSNEAVEKTTLEMMDVFHIRGFGEGPVGVNVIQIAAQSIGWARAASLFGAAFFGNGTNLAGILSIKGSLKPEGFARMEQEIRHKFGGPGNAGKVMLSDQDASFSPVSVDAEKAQLIEANQYLVEEVCRWFGVPPHKVMHLLRGTFSNIEHQSIEVVVDSITPWVKRFEDEAKFKLFGPSNRLGLYTKMNMRALLRGDFKSQNEGLEIQRRNGIITADEWRSLTDLNRMPEGAGGDLHIVQAQYVPLARLAVDPPADASQPSPDPDSPVAKIRVDLSSFGWGNRP